MSTETSPTVETKPDTQVLAQTNKHLASLFKKSAEGEQVFKSSFAEALKFIKENRKVCTDEVIKLSLMDKKNGRALSEDSAKTELSRIRDLISDKGEERYNALQAGTMTVTMARKVPREIDPVTGKPKGRGRPITTPQDAFKSSVKSLCEATIKQLPQMTKDEFLGYLNSAFDAAVAERDANKAALEAAKSKGLVSGGVESKGGFEPVQAPSVPEPAAA